jgi:acyl-CoA thioester hydrolase
MTVARSEIDYLLPITQFGVNYDMHLWVEKVGNSSYTCAYELVKDDVIYAKMKTVQVMIDIEKMKSRPLAEDERAFLNSYLLP